MYIYRRFRKTNAFMGESHRAKPRSEAQHITLCMSVFPPMVARCDGWKSHVHLKKRDGRDGSCNSTYVATCFRSKRCFFGLRDPCSDGMGPCRNTPNTVSEAGPDDKPFGGGKVGRIRTWKGWLRKEKSLVKSCRITLDSPQSILEVRSSWKTLVASLITRPWRKSKSYRKKKRMLFMVYSDMVLLESSCNFRRRSEVTRP